MIVSVHHGRRNDVPDEIKQPEPATSVPPLTPQQKQHILAAVEKVGTEVVSELESGSFTWRNLLIVLTSLLVGGGVAGTGTYFAARPGDPLPAPRDAIIFPKRIEVKLGHAARITPDVAGDVTGLTWLAPDSGDWFTDTNSTAAFTAWSTGDYPVIGVGIQGGKIVFGRTTIGVTRDDPAPVPPPPNPTPPDPPKPPPTPVPPSPLTAKFQAAYTADPATATTKSGQKILLQGLYEAMVDHAKLTTIATAGALLADLKTVAGQMIAPNSLVELRKVIAAEIASSIGTDAQAKLDPDLRGKAVDAFTRIAKSLSEVK
jgi:hypothetical protein